VSSLCRRPYCRPRWRGRTWRRLRMPRGSGRASERLVAIGVVHQRAPRLRKHSPARCTVSAPSRALPAPGQMLAAERKQGPAPCCWIRLQGEACCAGFGAAESSEFAWKQHAADFALDFCIDPTVSNGPASTERAVWRVVGHRAAQFESCFALTAGARRASLFRCSRCRRQRSARPPGGPQGPGCPGNAQSGP
jgi:hypothetical protein